MYYLVRQYKKQSCLVSVREIPDYISKDDLFSIKFLILEHRFVVWLKSRFRTKDSLLDYMFLRRSMTILIRIRNFGLSGSSLTSRL